MINPILTGVSTAAQALESLFFPGAAHPASSSSQAFSTGQGLPLAGGAQAAPSNHSDRFSHAALGVLTALQDPASAVAGFVHGAETAIEHDVAGLAHILERLKDALTGAPPNPAGVSTTAQATGSATATALASPFTGLINLIGGGAGPGSA